MSAAVRLRTVTFRAVSLLLLSRIVWFCAVIAVFAAAAVRTPLVTSLSTSLVHWDSIAYLDIAEHGYPAHLDYHDAFLPGYPLLVHIAALAFRDYVLSSWLVNLLAEALALWYVYRLVLSERERSGAQFSVWLLAFAPTAVFLIAPFSESTFIAAAAASLYYARQGRSLAACAAAAVAVAIRLTGLALLPALALELILRRRLRQDALHLLLVPIPLVAYCLYMQAHVGDALAFYDAEKLPAFGQTAAPPWSGFATTWNTMMTTPDGEVRSIFAREVAFGLLGLVASIAMWVSARIPRSFALYCSLAWLMTASLSFWRSEPRYLLALFPALLLLVDATARRRRARNVIVTVSALLMVAGTWIYAQGRWLG